MLVFVLCGNGLLCLLALPCSLTSLFFLRDKSAQRTKGKGKGERRRFASSLSLSHSPSRFKLVTSRTCFTLALTSSLVGRSKRLRRRQLASLCYRRYCAEDPVHYTMFYVFFIVLFCRYPTVSISST